MALIASDLTCVRSDRTLFEGLSLCLNPGDLLYLRGPNGAGKTSLLRLLTGLCQPDNGTIEYQQRPIVDPVSSFYQELIFVGHKTGLNPHLSAIDNLRFWTAQHRVVFEVETVFQVLETLGLTGLEEIPVRYLSAGQQRRVALSRLWLKPAKVWVLDEPFTALDAQGIALLEKKFHQHIQCEGMLLTTSHQALSERAGHCKVLDLEYRF